MNDLFFLLNTPLMEHVIFWLITLAIVPLIVRLLRRPPAEPEPEPMPNFTKPSLLLYPEPEPGPILYSRLYTGKTVDLSKYRILSSDPSDPFIPLCFECGLAYLSTDEVCVFCGKPLTYPRNN